MFEKIEARFRAALPPVTHASLRLVRERNEHLSARRNALDPPRIDEDLGAMVTVHDSGGTGYAATSDLSASGLGAAIAKARDWARLTAGRGMATGIPRSAGHGEYESAARTPWESVPLAERLAIVQRECERLRTDERIVDWSAGLWHTDLETLRVTSDGGRLWQRFRYLLPTLSATANAGSESQTRTFGGHAYCRQGGLEILDDVGFHDAAPQIGAEAVELLLAPDCPTGVLDLVLGPEQMILQIHESIGHPLELDRILGDERNYAGTSFVTLDMFGTYRYGSELLNVTFDPTRREQLASYAFDDEGEPAERQFLIRDGILLRPLGGSVSARRAGLPGVATARASGWNRPPIDRMANLNLEPGSHSFAELVGAVEHGVYMETNCSWSIDDSRNKFQFGCEYGRLIENGRLAHLVKKANYRGISATFWRNLAAVGGPDTLCVLGTPYCGKGEPNQLARVGHASPACRFSAVEVFGGA